VLAFLFLVGAWWMCGGLWIPSTANFRHVPNDNLVELPDFLVLGVNTNYHIHSGINLPLFVQIK
jgi:hypothetical protein